MYALYRGVCTKAYAGSGKPSFETHEHVSQQEFQKFSFPLTLLVAQCFYSQIVLWML